MRAALRLRGNGSRQRSACSRGKDRERQRRSGCKASPLQPIAPFHPPVQSPERRGKYLQCSSSRWSEHGSIEKEFVWKFDFQICAIVALKPCGIISKCLLSGIFLMINLIPRQCHAHYPQQAKGPKSEHAPMPTPSSLQD